MSDFVAGLLAHAEPEIRKQLGHPFVRGLADGTLSEERFAFFLAQDFAFLADYGRALRRAAELAPQPDWRRRLTEIAAGAAADELELHRGWAAEHGLDLAAVEPSATTRAYGGFLTEPHPFPVLVAALLPCFWGYAELGRRLAAAPTAPRYARWLATYADPAFAEAARWFVELAAACAEPDARPAMRAAFARSLAFEAAFWDAAWELRSS
ncbi:MAG TPA: TenA family protein [Gaiellaceae bacterium]|nr:TenA family protein [Gaiellaceae bacterium]